MYNSGSLQSVLCMAQLLCQLLLSAQAENKTLAPPCWFQWFLWLYRSLEESLLFFLLPPLLQGRQRSGRAGERHCWSRQGVIVSLKACTAQHNSADVCQYEQYGTWTKAVHLNDNLKITKSLNLQYVLDWRTKWQQDVNDHVSCRINPYTPVSADVIILSWIYISY